MAFRPGVEGRWPAAGAQSGRRSRAAPRRFFTPATVVWLAASVPAVLYLVVGALPATSGLQRAMRGPVGLWALVLAALASAVALALQLRPLVGALRSVPATSLHEVRVRLQERLVAMSGALVAVVPLLIVALTTRDANRYVVENHHALEALGTALLILGLALIIAAFFLFPPFGLAMTTAGTLALVSTLTRPSASWSAARSFCRGSVCFSARRLATGRPARVNPPARRGLLGRRPPAAHRGTR